MCCHPPFVCVVATDGNYGSRDARRAGLVGSLDFCLFSIFLPGASLFEHLFPAAQREPCVYISFAIAPNRAERSDITDAERS